MVGSLANQQEARRACRACRACRPRRIGHVDLGCIRRVDLGCVGRVGHVEWLFTTGCP